MAYRVPSRFMMLHDSLIHDPFDLQNNWNLNRNLCCCHSFLEETQVNEDDGDERSFLFRSLHKACAGFHVPFIWVATASLHFFYIYHALLHNAHSFCTEGTTDWYLLSAVRYVFPTCWDLFHFYRVVRRATKNNNYVLDTVFFQQPIL